MSTLPFELDKFIVPTDGKRVKLSDYDCSYHGEIFDKKAAQKFLEKDKEELAKYQDMLYAQDRYSLLIVFQARDAAGKDSTIKHVMSGVNPAGCQVFSFKKPSDNELDHGYLWRHFKALPQRGRIGIFNRSHYEEVIITRVHPEILDYQKLPQALKGKIDGKDIYERRYEEINCFEKYLVNNGTRVLKFFLNVSAEEQKERFLERIDRPEKNWKFSMADVDERAHWDKYNAAFEQCFQHTSTPWAPWHIIPADRKWFTRIAVSEIITETLKSLDLAYPKPAKGHKAQLSQARKRLTSE